MTSVTEKITRWDVGMDTDYRNSQGFQSVRHFDVHPHKLVPHRNTVTHTTPTAATYELTRFAYHVDIVGGKSGFWGLGKGVSAGIFDIQGTDPIANNWDTRAVITSGTVDDSFLFPYKNDLFFIKTNGQLAQFDIATEVLTEAVQTFNANSNLAVTFAEPIHHPIQDNAYFFAQNVVHELDNTTWSLNKLTIPDSYYITTATPYRNWLAIGAAPKNDNGDSVIFLWDMTNTTDDVEQINAGPGTIAYLAELEGNLVSVSDQYLRSARGLKKGRLVSRVLQGNKMKVSRFIESNDVSVFRHENKLTFDNKMYFVANLSMPSSSATTLTNNWVWSVDEFGRFGCEIVEEANSVATDYMTGIYRLQNYWYTAFGTAGAVYKTNDQETYTYTSVIETKLFDSGDNTLSAQVVGASVGFEPLPSGATVTLKYKLPSDTDWITVGSTSEVGADRLSPVRVSATGEPFKPYREADYRIESTGGAVITSFKPKTELQEDDTFNHSKK